MSFRLLPKDPKFFELFIADGDNLAAAATALHEMVDQYDRLEVRVPTSRRLRSAATRSTGRSPSDSRTRS